MLTTGITAEAARRSGAPASVVEEDSQEVAWGLVQMSVDSDGSHNKLFWNVLETKKYRESPKNNSVWDVSTFVTHFSSRCMSDMSGFTNIIQYDRLWKASGELKAPLHHHSICSVQTGKVPWWFHFFGPSCSWTGNIIKYHHIHYLLRFKCVYPVVIFVVLW